MSFALAHKSKTNKSGNDKISTPAKHHSFTYPNHRINNLNRNSVDSIFYLQRAIGNQAVQKLMRSKGAAFDFAKVGIQPKLKVSQPNEEYEQEVDKVAEQIMRMPVSSDLVMPIDSRKDKDIMSRKCAACEMKERKEDEDEDEKQLHISRKPSQTVSNLEASDEITNEIDSIRSTSGSTLDVKAREFMESRFGFNFSNVRIHADERAAQSANLLNTLAYTVGNDIVFAEGQYQTSTESGRRLLAHELTHVTQQDSNSSSNQIIRQAEPKGENQPLICRYWLNDAEQIETAAALQTLNLSGRVSQSFIVTVGALSARGRFIPTILDNKYWFAKLYEIITYMEIAHRSRFRYPAFVMHFIPIFYNMYYDALQHFLNNRLDQIHGLWLTHFQTAGRPAASGARQWMNEVEATIKTGVAAHIKGDMASALEQAFRSYAAKYCLQDASFDIYKNDFFEVNKDIFELVKASFLIELAKFSPSPLSIEMTQFLFAAGEQLTGRGLSVSEIYQWRERAWQQALQNLSASP
jgi:hypothetical protein